MAACSSKFEMNVLFGVSFRSRRGVGVPSVGFTAAAAYRATCGNMRQKINSDQKQFQTMLL